MSNTKLEHFYFPWPNLGIKLSRQWENLRENTEKEAPLVRAAYVDPQPSSANAPGEHDLSGWAIGERDFRNKFRIWYDKDNDRFSIQYNSGTEDLEVWNDYLSIRQVDGRVTIHGYGGLDTTVGGFYTPLARNLAVSGTFTPASTEWIWAHNLNTKPILWNTFNLEDKSITPQSVDVSNLNVAYFYFSQPYAGRAIAVAEVARGDGILITDGTNDYPQSVKLTFSNQDFYITTNTDGSPIINSRGTSGGGGGGGGGGLDNVVEDTSPELGGDLEVNDFNILGKDSVGSGNAGHVDILGGDAPGSGRGGNVNITGGTSVSGAPGSVNLEALGSSINLSADSVGINSDLDMAVHRIHNIVDPVDPQDAATKSYVDTRFADFYRNLPSGSGSGINNVVEDTTPQLGGNLDVNGFEITAADVVGINDATDVKIIGADSVNGNAGAIVITAGTASGAGGQGAVNISSPGGGVGISAAEGVSINAAGVSIGASVGAVTISPTTHIDVNNTAIKNLLDPVDAQDAVTKAYLQANTGGGFYGIYILESDGNPPAKRNDTLTFDSQYFYITGVGQGNKPLVSLRPTASGAAGVTDHGALTGLTDDDHPQYSLVDGTRAFTGTVGGVTPTSAAHLTTKGYVDGAVGPGFYGVFVRESQSGATTYKNDTVVFDSLGFYINATSAGKPMVSLRIGPPIAHQDLTGLATGDPHPQYVLKVEATPGFYGILIRESDGTPTDKRNDSITFDSQYFYIVGLGQGNKPLVSLRPTSGSGGTALTVKDIDGAPTVSNVSTIQFTNGTVTDQGGGVAEVTVTAGSGITAIDDGVRSYSGITALGYNKNDFYLSKSTTANKAIVNLRNEEIWSGHIPLAQVENYVIEPFSQHNYTIGTITLKAKNGTCTAAFYISTNLMSGGIENRGTMITPTDPTTINSTLQNITPTAGNTLGVGNRLKLSIYANSAATHITYSIRVSKN